MASEASGGLELPRFVVRAGELFWMGVRGSSSAHLDILHIWIARRRPHPRGVWRARSRRRFSIPSGVAGTNLRKTARYAGKNCDPLHFTSEPEVFENRRTELNQVLIFSGFSLEKNGKLRRQQAAATLDEAQERANRLKAELRRRGVHHDVLAFCRAELIQSNYFHAVFEATKSVAEEIRSLPSLTMY